VSPLSNGFSLHRINTHLILLPNSELLDIGTNAARTGVGNSWMVQEIKGLKVIIE
jgi:hypothetical protein